MVPLGADLGQHLSVFIKLQLVVHPRDVLTVSIGGLQAKTFLIPTTQLAGAPPLIFSIHPTASIVFVNVKTQA
jgi:hypothetical protein